MYRLHELRAVEAVLADAAHERRRASMRRLQRVRAGLGVRPVVERVAVIQREGVVMTVAANIAHVKLGAYFVK